MKITKNLLIPVFALLLMAVTVFVACNKNASTEKKSTKETTQNASLKRTISLGSIPLYYKDGKGSLVAVTLAKMQGVYTQYALLPTGTSTLLSSERVDGLDDDGNAIIGIRTKWQHPDGEKYTSATSRMVKSTDRAGNDIYIIGDSEIMGYTSTCSCEGFCSSGCDAGTGGFCTCSPCVPSGDCKKTSTVVYISEFSLY